MKKILILLLICVMNILPSFSATENYIEYLGKTMHIMTFTQNEIEETVKYCELIEDLDEKATSLTKGQLYALKTAVKYKKYSVLAQALEINDDKEFNKLIKDGLSEIRSDYASRVAGAKGEFDRNLAKLLLGAFDMFTNNDKTGAETVKESLLKISDKEAQVYFAQILDITTIMCKTIYTNQETLNKIVTQIKNIKYQ